MLDLASANACATQNRRALKINGKAPKAREPIGMFLYLSNFVIIIRSDVFVVDLVKCTSSKYSIINLSLKY